MVGADIFAVVVVGLGVDQENAGAAGEVTDDLIAGEVSVWVEDMVSQLSIGLEGEADDLVLPLTRLSKSSSVAPFESSVVPATAPKDMKSSFAIEAPLDWPSSCSFLVCSSSTRADNDLIRSMNCLNCSRFSSGPRLMCHNVGRISMATKSASATCPTTLHTFRAAIMTAGSFVLIALMSGMIFSCIVYLSSAVDEDVFLFCVRPLSPSSD